MQIFVSTKIEIVQFYLLTFYVIRAYVLVYMCIYISELFCRNNFFVGNFFFCEIQYRVYNKCFVLYVFKKNYWCFYFYFKFSKYIIPDLLGIVISCNDFFFFIFVIFYNNKTFWIAAFQTVKLICPALNAQSLYIIFHGFEFTYKCFCWNSTPVMETLSLLNSSHRYL